MGPTRIHVTLPREVQQAHHTNIVSELTSHTLTMETAVDGSGGSGDNGIKCQQRELDKRGSWILHCELGCPPQEHYRECSCRLHATTSEGVFHQPLRATSSERSMNAAPETATTSVRVTTDT